MASPRAIRKGIVSVAGPSGERADSVTGLITGPAIDAVATSAVRGPLVRVLRRWTTHAIRPAAAITATASSTAANGTPEPWTAGGVAGSVERDGRGAGDGLAAVAGAALDSPGPRELAAVVGTGRSDASCVAAGGLGTGWGSPLPASPTLGSAVGAALGPATSGVGAADTAGAADTPGVAVSCAEAAATTVSDAASTTSPATTLAV